MWKTIRYFLAIITLIIVSFTYINANEKNKLNTPKELLHFVQISDIHLNYPEKKDLIRMRGSSQKLLAATVNQINTIEGLDFVLSTGDFVDFPDQVLVDKYHALIMAIQYPVYTLLGNHENYILQGTGMGTGIQKFQTRLNKKELIKAFYTLKNPTSFTNQMPYYSFSPNSKFEIICLDLSIEDQVANGKIDDVQLEWLKNKIKENTNKYIIIASHFPIIEPFPSADHFILNPGREKLLQLINESSNVIGYFSGHYHSARLFKIKNKIHNSNPSIIEYPNAFREITISQEYEGYLSVRFKFHMVDEKELVQQSKSDSKAWALKYGTQEDRDSLILFKLY